MMTVMPSNCSSIATGLLQKHTGNGIADPRRKKVPDFRVNKLPELEDVMSFEKLFVAAVVGSVFGVCMHIG
jgi:hypothetical protein